MVPLETGRIINKEHLILQWIPAKERLSYSWALPHLASVMAETSEPRGCGRGNVQTKFRSTGLKARTVPSAQPQKIISSDRDRDWATPVCEAGHDTTGTSAHLQMAKFYPCKWKKLYWSGGESAAVLPASNDKGYRRLQWSINASLLEYFQTHPVLVLVPIANLSLILWQKAGAGHTHLHLHLLIKHHSWTLAISTTGCIVGT